MLSDRELALLYTLARDYANGSGAIVDAGCFLGGSSAALLAGVKDRAEPWTGPPVSSYDLFRVSRRTVGRYFSGETPLAIGDSYRALFDEHVAGFGVPHVVHEGDIREIGWSGGPIDILFLDVLKDWAVNDAVLRQFLPHAVPGRTLLVHQDYGYGQAPWLHITVELMRDSLRWIDAMPYATHLFLLEQPLPESLLHMSIERDLSEARKVELIDRAIAREDGEWRPMLELSKAGLLTELGRAREGRLLVDAVEDRHVDDVSVLECARRTRRWMLKRLLPEDSRRSTRRSWTRGS